MDLYFTDFFDVDEDVLDMQYALSKNPQYRLLSNPYDPKCRGVYEIEDAGVRMRYRLKS